MTTLYDPRRPRVGSIPTLLGRPSWIVPRLTIWPDESTFAIVVSAMIPADGEEYLSRQVSTCVEASQLPLILARYRSDPEKFFLDLFGTDLSTKNNIKNNKNNNINSCRRKQRATEPQPQLSFSDDEV